MQMNIVLANDYQAKKLRDLLFNLKEGNIRPTEIQIEPDDPRIVSVKMEGQFVILKD